MAVTSNFSFDRFSVFYVCLIWSFIILLRPPEHKKNITWTIVVKHDIHMTTAGGISINRFVCCVVLFFYVPETQTT